MRHHSCILGSLVVAAVAGLGLSAPTAGQAGDPGVAPGKPASERAKDGPRTFEDAILAEVNGIVGALPDARDLRTSAAEMSRLFDLAIAHADLDKRVDVLIETGAWRRLLNQLHALKPELRARVMPTLLENPALARRLALTVGPQDKPEAVYSVLAELIEKRPKAVGDGAGLGNLIAAVCVVFDEARFPPRRPDGLTPAQVRELEKERQRNRSSGREVRLPRGPELPPAEALDVVEVFDFFAQNAGRMLFPPRTTPPELLIHTVNTRATVADLRWAQGRYQNNRNIGTVYGSITYDTAAFRYGREKKVWQADGGYTLENIKKVGGVCEEQAFFAAHCGKAIGVPTVEVTVTGPDVAHAYVGYLSRKGDRTVWDFREGRYDEYEDIRGNVTDPQSGRVVSSSQIGLSAGLVKSSARDLAAAIVLVDAAERIGQVRGVFAVAQPRTQQGGSGAERQRERAGPTYPPAPDAAWPAPTTAAARAADLSTHELMLQAAASAAPGYAPAWLAAARLGELREMGAKQKNDWCRAVMRLCAGEFPDFAVEIVTPLIRTSGSAQAQSDLWDWCAKQFVGRPDLVARSRFNQAQAWAAEGQPGKAWTILKDVAIRYPEDGTVVVDALAAIERLLADEGKPATAAIPVFEDAFRRIGKPGQLSPGFETQSNFYRVGSRLADLYDAAGEGNKAKMTRDRIGREEE
jgi:hypothetical protein